MTPPSPSNGIEFRRPRSDEIGEFLRVSIQSYGSDGSDEEVANEVLSNEIERSFGAFVDGRCVGGSGAFSFELTMPGGRIVPAAGVTMIGVAPTFRRRGILTKMVRRLHEDAAERGEPIALLTASETSIYRRFGYGIASDVAHLQVAAQSVRFDPPLDDTGTFELIDPHIDTSVLEELHDRIRRLSVGWTNLPAGMWAQIRRDPVPGRGGRTPLRGVIHRDGSGNGDGYVTWRIAPRRHPDRLAGNTLHIEHLTAADGDTEAALWGFLASIDLVTEVSWDVAPVDPAIRHRLVEPRQLRTLARADMVWARLLDVPAALSARGYGATASITLGVTDRFETELGGRFRLECAGRNELGRCERIGNNSGPADLTIDTADLASITMGGVTPSLLAAAGRLVGSAHAIDTADALFVLPQRPWYPIEF